VKRLSRSSRRLRLPSEAIEEAAGLFCARQLKPRAESEILRIIRYVRRLWLTDISTDSDSRFRLGLSNRRSSLALRTLRCIWSARATDKKSGFRVARNLSETSELFVLGS